MYLSFHVKQPQKKIVRTALSKKRKSQSLENESLNLEVEILSRNSKGQRVKLKKYLCELSVFAVKCL